MTIFTSREPPAKMSGSLTCNSYMGRVSHLFSPDYVPSDKDILQMCLRTIGVTEMKFEVDSQQYAVFDVGGTRSERKKWIHTFGQCHQVVFVASLSGYDEYLVEDATTVSHAPILRHPVMASWAKADLSSVQNQTHESLIVFESLMSLSWFKKSAITLVLTKVDLFEDKVKIKPIRDYFPDYLGPSNDSEAGREYFVQKYLSLNKTLNRKINVICADVTDTSSFEPRLSEIMRTAALVSEMETLMKV